MFSVKYIWIGIGISVIGSLLSLVIWGLDKMFLLTAIISGVLIALCAILSGTLATGDRMRANYNTETSEDRLNRDKFTTKCFFLAIPNIIVTVLFYFLSFKGII